MSGNFRVNNVECLTTKNIYYMLIRQQTVDSDLKSNYVKVWNLLKNANIVLYYTMNNFYSELQIKFKIVIYRYN